MICYFTLPGLGGSDDNHWQTHFERILSNCKRVEQRSWDKPERNDWIRSINEAIEGYEFDSVIFICHSLGGIALSHWINTYQRKIKGAFIVAPPNVDGVSLEYGLGSFLPVPQKTIPFPTVFVASTNDQWSKFDNSKKLGLAGVVNLLKLKTLVTSIPTQV